MTFVANVVSISSDSIKSVSSIDSRLSKRGVDNLLDKFMKNPERYAITFSLKLDGGSGKHGFHEVSLTRVEGDRVYFTNPWDSKKEFSVTRSELFEMTYNVSIADMQGATFMENLTNETINFMGMFI